MAKATHGCIIAPQSIRIPWGRCSVFGDVVRFFFVWLQRGAICSPRSRTCAVIFLAPYQVRGGGVKPARNDVLSRVRGGRSSDTGESSIMLT